MMVRSTHQHMGPCVDGRLSALASWNRPEPLTNIDIIGNTNIVRKTL